jgi:hypothetical protein
MDKACESLDCKLDKKTAWFDGWNNGYEKGLGMDNLTLNDMYYLSNQLMNLISDLRSDSEAMRSNHEIS